MILCFSLSILLALKNELANLQAEIISKQREVKETRKIAHEKRCEKDSVNNDYEEAKMKFDNLLQAFIVATTAVSVGGSVLSIFTFGSFAPVAVGKK